MKTFVSRRKCHCPNPKALRVRRGGEIAGWLLSGATLVLMPKCPACLAAYVALATGAGITFTTAAWVRTFLLLLSLGSMAWLAANRLRSRRSTLRPVRTD